MQFGNVVAILVFAGAGAEAWYQPAAGTTWDWQLQVPINPTAAVQVYDIDMFDNTAAVVADLHSRGKKVICYIDVGSWENYRSDASKFPASLLGAKYSGFPNERWLDIRSITTSPLGPILIARFQQAKAKGCDGTAHESSGFPLTYNDQIVFNRWVADQVHALEMAVGLKNDINQVKDLVGNFDFHASEQAFQYGEYSFLVPFIQANKPVFEAEYRNIPYSRINEDKVEVSMIAHQLPKGYRYTA
ncbi:glycoside hydrolase family 114 protein [Hyaloscypha bicolor E]|uniref:alpha-galactosidase n=1 Tax=Hyaloscypha bicolor E TaxID=1095630 RepID=A0A2J6T0V9_9HELO|nr:glycoside hydrolase family 114 protein [Hyaloscypha bicolor E]PMD56656.1 glycoside hydrolase family 114 protein [Hyaloscypha bicolor E]